MNEKSIQKLRRKFIILSMITLVSVMLVMFATIYFVNIHTTVTQVNKTLDYLADNDGMLPHDEAYGSDDFDVFPKRDKNFWTDMSEDLFKTGIDSGEFLYSVRFFSVVYDDKGNIAQSNTAHITKVDESQAPSFAKTALDSGKEYGAVGDYSFKVKRSADKTVVVCVDTTIQTEFIRRIGNISLAILLVGSLLVFIFIRIISGRVIKPEIRAAEQQKQFITNAGHELKTPLAVIRANTELEMMMHGEDEWNRSTMNQVDRMTQLINDLVTAAKAEERADKSELTDVDVSKTINDVADAFVPVATQDGKTLEKDIPSGVTMRADEGQISQLATLLVDNAIKYCDAGGTVRVQLASKGRGVRLCVSNNYAQGENVDYSKFFERFYRRDESHNIDKGGYGIGLSIADGIVRGYRGKIDVSWKDGVIEFCCILKGV